MTFQRIRPPHRHRRPIHNPRRNNRFWAGWRIGYQTVRWGLPVHALPKEPQP